VLNDGYGKQIHGSLDGGCLRGGEIQSLGCRRFGSGRTKEQKAGGGPTSGGSMMILINEPGWTQGRFSSWVVCRRNGEMCKSSDGTISRPTGEMGSTGKEGVERASHCCRIGS